MLKNKSEILNLERANLLDTCYKYEDELASLKGKCLKNWWYDFIYLLYKTIILKI